MIAKRLFRSIRATFSRYLAILAIVALGVGFYTGLKNAQPSMQITADEYMSELNMFDIQLISTLGLTRADVQSFADTADYDAVEGGFRLDVLAETGPGETVAYQALSLPKKLALPRLTAGRMPVNSRECVADALVFGPEAIGSTVTLSADNETDTLDMLRSHEFTIVGLAQSPRFISRERGSTSVGSGTLSGFLYLPAAVFDSDVYHELLVKAKHSEAYFTDGYERAVDTALSAAEELLEERAWLRYETLRGDAEEALQEARDELAEGREAYDKAISYGVPASTLADTMAELEDAEEQIREGEEELAELKEPSTYALTLESNTGCVSYQNDIGVVDGIANAFPVFFVLIAALVCVTTMTRMVNDERTQIGTLKALGYANRVISRKYTLYAGSSSLLGCLIGFFLGSRGVPLVIWEVYDINYGFTELIYAFNPVLFVGCVALALFGSVGVTLMACRQELRGKPAELIRPKSPGSGKRILLERITPLWKHLSFLSKVTIRNAFRYKKRMVMMLLGIGGCTALIVTGFGLKDSVANILNFQYDEIHLYDMALTFEESVEYQVVESALLREADAYTLAFKKDLTLRSPTGEKEASVVAVPPETAGDYFRLHSGSTPIAYPAAGHAVLSRKLAGQLEVEAGSRIEVFFPEKTVTLTVDAVCDNYLNHYLYTSPESVPGYEPNSAYLLVGPDTPHGQIAARLRTLEGVSHVQVTEDERAIMESTMSSMNYIVIFVILCAGALAFIVLYNLTNINIMERIREVATVKVLGFHASETASYVLRENLLLSVLGAALGLILGKLLHWYVMMQVQVDTMAFDIRILPQSYLYSFVCTVLFALIANFFMRFKLEKVNMAESLKSVE